MNVCTTFLCIGVDKSDMFMWKITSPAIIEIISDEERKISLGGLNSSPNCMGGDIGHAKQNLMKINPHVFTITVIV